MTCSGSSPVDQRASQIRGKFCANHQRSVVFCSHDHNSETRCGDPVPVDWSTCQLSENVTCGRGIKTRLLSCVRSDGKPVGVDQCEQHNLEKPQRMSIHCLVECVVNCQLSGWTAWTECSKTCGHGGRMSRTRFIIMPTQGEGRPCPTELTQQKTCPVTPCYSWVLSNWSSCKLELLPQCLALVGARQAQQPPDLLHALARYPDCISQSPPPPLVLPLQRPQQLQSLGEPVSGSCSIKLRRA
nr:thrombospondin type-1 domain-containing protein 7B-like [Mirounga angustirostris]